MAIMLMRFWIIDARLGGNRGTSQGNSEFFASHLEGSDRKKTFNKAEICIYHPEN